MSYQEDSIEGYSEDDNEDFGFPEFNDSFRQIKDLSTVVLGDLVCECCKGSGVKP